MSIYENVEVLENSEFIIRKTKHEDCNGLFKVYSDIKALPFFNSDNCHGDDFYYDTIEKMEKAIGFWERSYTKGYFVRWTIIHKKNNEIIGTIENFLRQADDYFNNVGLLRLDLKSTYEKADVIKNILNLITPVSYDYFNCNRIVTKGFPDSIERINGLMKSGYKKSEECLVGTSDLVKYFNYWYKDR